MTIQFQPQERRRKQRETTKVREKDTEMDGNRFERTILTAMLLRL